MNHDDDKTDRMFSTQTFSRPSILEIEKVRSTLLGQPAYWSDVSGVRGQAPSFYVTARQVWS